MNNETHQEWLARHAQLRATAIGNMPKLLLVVRTAVKTERGTVYSFTGHFDDGTQSRIRKTFNAYTSCAQVYDSGYYNRRCGSFRFSTKPNVILGRGDEVNLVSRPQMELR